MDTLIYNYDPATLAFLSAAPADVSPLDPDQVLVPAHATLIAPPEILPNTWPVFDAQAQAWVLVADWRGAYYEIATGQPITVTALGVQPAEMGLTNLAPPAGPAVFAAGAWERDLATERTLAWTAIKARRDAIKVGGVQVGAYWFHSDADSRIQHLGLKDKARDLLAAGGTMADAITILGQPVQWKTLSGAFVTVTVQLAYDIVTAAGNLDATAFAVAETHRQAMEAAADPALYDFSVGWPPAFIG
ncbi:MAG: hypothetical protein A3H93_17185 [Rhodocyclales bacterium RIFCSPLOWO2_02_FULL_63_24]|nr:MAG: hypothetical protein A3H93_17185 [Rhodocyclales bacterium RIFCSPLOWO2_02_FULL_63_24]